MYFRFDCKLLKDKNQLKKLKVTQSCPTLWDPMDYTVHRVLQARILKWVAISFSRGSYPPRDQTRVSYIVGRFFTSWATREAYKVLVAKLSDSPQPHGLQPTRLSVGFSRQEYWSGLPFPSPGDLPDPGIKPKSPALQVDSLPLNRWGSPFNTTVVTHCYSLEEGWRHYPQ